jgi:hypothetical protein
MRLLGIPFALIFALAVVADTSAVGNGKNKPHVVHGKVKAVTLDKNNGTGTVMVETHHRKKGTTAVVVREHKFKVTADTQFEMAVHNGKAPVQRKPATFADVKIGEHVAVVPMEGAHGVAQRVEIVVHNHGNPAGQPAGVKPIK